MESENCAPTSLTFREILDFIRIKDWFYHLGIPTLGFVWNSIHAFSFSLFLAMGGISSCLLGLAYSLNQYFERKEKRRYLLLFPLFFLILSALLSIVLSFATFLLTFFAILIAITYSIPPLRLKRLPFLGSILNSFGYSLLFLIGFSIPSDLSLNGFCLAALIAMIWTPVQLIHELEHLEKDKRAGIMTTALKLGAAKTILLMQIFFFISTFLAFALFVILKFSIFLFISTVLFSFLAIFTIRLLKNFRKMRITIRRLGVLYGILLLICSYL
jgi:4-hydroxybenzoate polyprenyltransferase